MNKREKQLEAFITQAEQIAREWTIAEVKGEDTHPYFADKMYMVHEIAKEVMSAEDDKAAKDDA